MQRYALAGENDDAANTRSELSALASYLNVADTDEEILARKERRKIPGSGEWLLEHQDFRSWADRDDVATDGAPQIFWLSGDPGCGKSYLASTVINHLRERGEATSFFFLKYGDVSRQSIGPLLKSLAYQMARVSKIIREILLAMQHDDTLTADSGDLRTTWRQLFDHNVFQAEIGQHQYWVIDALDEAKDGVELLNLLQSLPKQYSVFITSRRDQALSREALRFKANLITHQVKKEDTAGDIRLFLENNEDDLPVDQAVEAQILIRRLVEKANGSFLWASLIMRGLADCWTEEGLDDVLNNVPDGMQLLYTRILGNISRSPNYQLAKAILHWVIGAVRPMSVTELRTAVRLSTGRTLKRSAQAIESICQALVSVSDDRVEPVHDTLRDFLFNKANDTGPSTEFCFDKVQCHESIAIICLEVLTRSLKLPTRKVSYEQAQKPSQDDDSYFVNYASEHFSEHVVKASYGIFRDDPRLENVLLQFLQGPLVLWIQRLAETNALSNLTRAGKNIRAYTLQQTPRDTLRELDRWADDIIHLVNVFGRDLYRDPTIILTTVPALCPSTSLIYSELRNPDVGLQVLGGAGSSWPDLISSSAFGRDSANALASCDKAFAVALRSCQICIVHTTTCQEARRIRTTEPVKLLRFVHIKDWLVAASERTIAMYNFETTAEIWRISTPNQAIAMVVDAGSLSILTTTRDKDVERFDLKTGERTECRHFDDSSIRGTPPMRVYLSIEMNIIAMVYRNEELELYELTTLQRLKGRVPFSGQVETVAFNPVLNMLAIATFHGQVQSVALIGMRKVQSAKIDARHLAVSTDGKTLLVGTKAGDICILDFETMITLHTIKYKEEEAFVDLAFASNSLRFLDIRRRVFNVWEPTVLVQRSARSASGDSSVSYYSAVSDLAQLAVKKDAGAITAFAAHHSGQVVFCAIEAGAVETGSVVVYETRTGKAVQRLLDYGKTEILLMEWNQTRDLLAFADNSGNIKVNKVLRETTSSQQGSIDKWQITYVMQRAFHQPIRQLLLSLDGEVLLVCTTTTEYVFRTSGEGPLLVQASAPSQSITDSWQNWATIFQRRNYLYDVRTGTQAIRWEEGASNLQLEHIPPAPSHSSEPGMVRRNAYLVPIGDQMWAAQDNNPHTPPIIWPRSNTQDTGEEAARAAAQALKEFERVALQINSIIGIYRNLMVFVSVDYWVCSVRIDKSKFEDPVRELFPMPLWWRRFNRPMRALVTSLGDLIFAIEGDVVIVKSSL